MTIKNTKKMINESPNNIVVQFIHGLITTSLSINKCLLFLIFLHIFSFLLHNI